MNQDPAGELFVKARELSDDYELASVRAFKQDNPGALAIGHMPVYSPRPLLEAVGCLPVAIFGGGDQVDIIKGDSYFQSYICQIPRSTIELGLSDAYKALDGMLFPSTCDVIRNLGGMWKLLFPQRYVAYVDLPQNFAPGIGGKFFASEMRRIGRELSEFGAKPLTDEALRQAIVDENEHRAAIRALDEVRREAPHKLSASEAYVAVRAGAAMLARDHTRFLNDIVAAVSKRPDRTLDRVKVILRGAFCEQPPIALIRSLERAGCDIVDDDFQLCMRMIEGDISTEGDPIQALADAFIHKGAATASRYIDEDEKGQALIKEVEAKGADGVIFAAASVLRPGAARPTDAGGGARAGVDPVHEFQVRGEHRPVSGHPRAGRRVFGRRQTVGQRGMSTDTNIDVAKDDSQTRQKNMIGAHFERLSTAEEDGRKVVYTFVPGNLTELITALDMLPVLPEINALQSGMRKRSGGFIREAEKAGALRGRLHLRQVRHRHAQERQHRPHRPEAAAARSAAVVVHRLLHLHEVVRAAQGGVQLPRRDAARALPGRRSHHRRDAPVRGGPAA